MYITEAVGSVARWFWSGNGGQTTGDVVEQRSNFMKFRPVLRSLGGHPPDEQ